MQPADLADFVKNRMASLCELLNSDVTQARAEVLRLVSEIRVVRRQTEIVTEYVAKGDWNLSGTYPEKDRARHLLGWLRGPATHRTRSSSLFELNYFTLQRSHYPGEVLA
jgi:hypothetical protein